MADLNALFAAAAEQVQKSGAKADNDTLLKLYALYKQATVGDVTGKRPGVMDLKGRAKFDAWTNVKGKAKTAAMEEYIALAKKIAT